MTGFFLIPAYISSKFLMKSAFTTVGSMNQAGESGMEDLGEEYDRQITEDATVMNFHSWGYFADGWPREYESYSEFKLMDSRKFKQKRIIWNRYNVGNH